MRKIAIVHDYLIDFGGAERVLLALHEIYPDAPVYVSVYRKGRLGKFADKFKGVKIIQSGFGYLPFADKLISPLRFLVPAIWNSFDLTGYDLIISSASWAVTKGFEKKKGAIEICYCHTPSRYLYGYDTSRRFEGLMGRLVGFYGLIVNHFMLQYDFKQAQKVDFFIANSQEVRKRIEKFYRRDSTVIYPPVEITEPDIKTLDRNYYLTGGRLTAAKNFDLIIEAFNKFGYPLKIYGSGPLENSLKNIAKNNVEFLGRVDDNEMAKLYSGAKAFILTQKDEDFGMTAVEAMSLGTPVIAYKGGGYLESVIDGKTGIFFDELSIESLSAAIRNFGKMKLKSGDCVSQAKKFSKERFEKEMLQFVSKAWRQTLDTHAQKEA
jgi:glycosyltransferase involved in cell wall biosynthesis